MKSWEIAFICHPKKKEHYAFIFTQSRYDITILSGACLSNFNKMDFFSSHFQQKKIDNTTFHTIQEIKSQEKKIKNDMCNLLPHFFTKQRKTINNIHRFMYIYINISSLHYTILFKKIFPLCTLLYEYKFLE